MHICYFILIIIDSLSTKEAHDTLACTITTIKVNNPSTVTGKETCYEHCNILMVTFSHCNGAAKLFMNRR